MITITGSGIIGDKMRLEDIYSEKIIERGEEYIGNVQSCIKIENTLFAKVHGSKMYTTKVDLTTLEAECSCPYQYNCKHGVAAYLYYKKGKITNADEFLKDLQKLDKAQLIKIIISLIPENPELASNHIFRKRTDFKSFVDDFIDSFSVKKMKKIEANLDRLGFEQLLKIVIFLAKNQDDIFDKAIANDDNCESGDYYSSYDDEGDFLYDFESKVKCALVKRIDSEKLLKRVLGKKQLHEQIIDTAEPFHKYKDIIRPYFTKKEYLWFLLNCSNPDLKEIKKNITSETDEHLMVLPRKNPQLAEQLAEVLKNNHLNFMLGYIKKDARMILEYLDAFDALVRMYTLIHASKVVDILMKRKSLNEKAIAVLFNKRFFADYNERHIQHLVQGITDSSLLERNITFSTEFLKLIPILERLNKLGFDIRKIFERKELLKAKHWTEIAAIIGFMRKKLGDSYVKEFIKSHKEHFITSSTLKSNLKQEGIYIQNIKGEFIVKTR
jgi:hypothetical protein